MHRGVADLVYDIRISRFAGVLRGSVWHQIRQELVPAKTRLAQGCISSAISTTTAHKPFAGMNLFNINIFSLLIHRSFLA